MIPYDLDPSLHSSEPAPADLGDGFSPRVPNPNARDAAEPAQIDSSPAVPAETD
jgi:hypothetical protein